MSSISRWMNFVKKLDRSHCEHEGAQEKRRKGVVNVASISPQTSARLANMSLLCALFVVSIHVPLTIAEGTFSWWFVEVVKRGITFCATPYFFAAAGYLLAGRTETEGWYRCEMGKRVRTLLLPYLIWLLSLYLCLDCAVVALLNLAHGRYFLEGVILNPITLSRRFGLTSLLIPRHVPTWFLRTLICFMLLSPLFVWIVRRGKTWAMLFVGALFVWHLSTCWMEIDCGNNVFHALFYGYGIVQERSMAYFVAGIAVRYYPIKLDLSLRKRLTLLLVMFVLVMLRPFVFEPSWALIPLVLSIVFLNVPCRALPKWLTSSAFPIYLLHLFVLGFWRKALAVLPFGSLLKSTWYGYLVQTAIVFGASLLLCLAMRRWLSRVSSIVFGGR